MSHFNPAVYLVWSILSSVLAAFLVYHLWCFDRFRCLRWNQGSQGAFKRIMTYSYITSIPLLFIYSVGFAIIKYNEGLIYIPPFGVIPKPNELWSSTHQRASFPLYLCASFAWGLEMVSHLEELCFWLFVVNAGPTQKEWFRSIYYKIWVAGSLSAILFMPLTTIFTRHDPNHCEASTFFAGSLGSGLVTLAFLPVLWKFPVFLRGLRRDNVDKATVVRLTNFHELNSIRIFFRAFFVISLLILSSDGLTPHKHVNEKSFATDFLATLGGIGLLVSSGITLVIFFPRSIEGEIEREATQNRAILSRAGARNLTLISHEQELYGAYDLESSADPDAKEDLDEASIAVAPSQAWSRSPMHPLPSLAPSPRSASYPESFRLEPNRRAPESQYMESSEGYQGLTSAQSIRPELTNNNLQVHNSPLPRRVSHFVQSFRSPIDFRRAT